MNKILLEKFLSGQANKTERIQFLDWIHSEDAVKEIEEIIQNSIRDDHTRHLWKDQDVLSRIKLRISEIDTDNVKNAKNKRDRYKSSIIELKKENSNREKASAKSARKWLKIAASIILLAACTAILWQVIPLQKPDVTETQDMFLRKSTNLGQKLSFYLDDGTKVKLNSGSEFTWRRFNQGNIREVKLKGEAYFEVVKNPGKPFIVKTGDINTVVLGTSFIVREDTENSRLTVALKNGSVEVRINTLEDNEQIILEPGEKVEIDLIDHSNEIKLLNKYESFGWTEGLLYFNEDTFEEVVKRLEQWYNVDIKVVNNVTTKMYSSKFKNENLEKVLIGLSFVNDFDYEINGKNVSIKFK